MNLRPFASRQLRSSKSSSSRRGLGLAEAMISLSIAAMLLTAAGAAFNASSMAIEENEKFFRVSQAARISMSRMLTQCRRGTVQLPDGHGSIERHHRRRLQ